MLKHAFPGAFAAAVLGAAVSGSPILDFAQDLPARCLPQDTQSGGHHDGCRGVVTFGMSGPRVVSGPTADVEATGSIPRSGRDGAEGSTARPE